MTHKNNFGNRLFTNGFQNTNLKDKTLVFVFRPHLAEPFVNVVAASRSFLLSCSRFITFHGCNMFDSRVSNSFFGKALQTKNMELLYTHVTCS